jgi:hypothetical protein
MAKGGNGRESNDYAEPGAATATAAPVPVRQRAGVYVF